MIKNLLFDMGGVIFNQNSEEAFILSSQRPMRTDQSAADSINETLQKMGLDYLDMMIIHSPQPWVEVNQSDNRYVEGNREAWRA